MYSIKLYYNNILIIIGDLYINYSNRPYNEKYMFDYTIKK